MTVPYAFSAATSAIPLSQLDDNFNTTITLGNTAIQLGNTVTTLNNMTLANVTISSGNVTITNVTVTTANVTTVNATTVIATTANVTTGNVTNLISGNVALTGGAINGTTLGATTAASANVTTLTTSSTVTISGGTANGVAYLNGSKVLTTGSALTFDGTILGNALTANATYSELLRLRNNGVGDGTGAKLSFNFSGTERGYVGATYSSGWITDLSGTDATRFLLSGSEQMRLTSTGLGIGITNPAYKLVVSNAGAAGLEVDPAGVNGGPLLQAYNRSGAAYVQLTYDGLQHVWRTSGTERARIGSNGKFSVNTTDTSFPGFFLVQQATSADEAISVWNSATSGDNNLVKFYTDGGAGRGSITYNRAGGLVAYNTTSDYRAKDIIGPVANPGATIDALKVYSGKMKGATQPRPMLVAHEAQAVAPYSVTGKKDAVNESGDPIFQQMDVSSLVPLLIAEIQSLRQRVAQLEGA